MIKKNEFPEMRPKKVFSLLVMFVMPNILYNVCLFQFKPYSDAYWECAVRYFTYPLYHDAGSCKMGPASDPKVKELYIFPVLKEKEKEEKPI